MCVHLDCMCRCLHHLWVNLSNMQRNLHNRLNTATYDKMLVGNRCFLLSHLIWFYSSGQANLHWPQYRSLYDGDICECLSKPSKNNGKTQRILKKTRICFQPVFTFTFIIDNTQCCTGAQGIAAWLQSFSSVAFIRWLFALRPAFLLLCFTVTYSWCQLQLL